MKFSDFKQAGHWPTLLSSFLYFDVSFMSWVALGPLMLYISRDMGFSVDEKFTLVAIPVLSGAFFRIILGIAADSLGEKRTGLIAQVVVIVAVAIVWRLGLSGKEAIEAFGLALGIAGASFAVALPQASRWYPPKYQGMVMGIAGAGNLGVVVDALVAPSLAENFGWQAVFGFLLIPLVLVLAFYVLASKDAPVARQPMSMKAYRDLLTDPDSVWFMFFYFITFGGFSGLANALPLYFTVQFHASGVAAGFLVALIVAFGSCFRPVGGMIADRIGGIQTLSVLFAIVATAYFAVAFLPVGPLAPDAKGFTLLSLPAIGWLAVGLFSMGALALGMGNGAVFQLIPQRFRSEIGVMTGLVGCAGGVGGFFLAKTLGTSKGLTGGFGAGFMFFAALALLGLVGLSFVKSRWRTTWGAASGARV